MKNTKGKCIICGKRTTQRSQKGYPLHAQCLGNSAGYVEHEMGGPNHFIPEAVRQKAGLERIAGHYPGIKRTPRERRSVREEFARYMLQLAHQDMLAELAAYREPEDLQFTTGTWTSNWDEFTRGYERLSGRPWTSPKPKKKKAPK